MPTYNFEVYYIIENFKRVKKIVAGPYYDYMEACNAREKLEKDNFHRDREFDILSHELELS